MLIGCGGSAGPVVFHRCLIHSNPISQTEADEWRNFFLEEFERAELSVADFSDKFREAEGNPNRVYLQVWDKDFFPRIDARVSLNKPYGGSSVVANARYPESASRFVAIVNRFADRYGVSLRDLQENGACPTE